MTQKPDTVENTPLKLAALARTTAIEYEREFDAPVSTLFRAYADIAVARQWQAVGPQELICETWDFRTGGQYRFTVRSGADEMVARGMFHTVSQNEVIIQTFELESERDVVGVERMLFQPLPAGRSLLSGRVNYFTQQSRDTHLESGLYEDLSDAHRALEQLITA